MAQVGQIIYNIQGTSSDELLSTSTDVNQVISSKDPDGTPNAGYESGRIDIWHDVVSLYNSKQFSKLGVQAPPGTRLVLNETKEILIGQNGIYELDDNIVITQLYFVQPMNYILDETASNEMLAQGKAAILAAENKRQAALDAIDPNTTEDYYTQYQAIQDAYEIEYNEALKKYNAGINGIYQVNKDNPYKELYNIIVDFLY